MYVLAVLGLHNIIFLTPHLQKLPFSSDHTQLAIRQDPQVRIDQASGCQLPFVIGQRLEIRGCCHRLPGLILHVLCFALLFCADVEQIYDLETFPLLRHGLY